MYKRQGLDAPHSEVAGFWAAAGSGDATAFGDDVVRGVPTGSDAMRGAPGASFRSDIGSTTALVTEPAVVIAKAHHGSVSKEKRLQVERELKAGKLPCVVATSSLELGIDMGSIDLVLQVAAPPSVASGLQRVGRANHQVGGRSQGVIFPRTRVEVIDAAVMAEGASPAPHPDSRLGSSSIWPHIEAAILDEVLAHKSTIVFVNSRGLCEKLTARLNELYAKRPVSYTHLTLPTN